MIFRQLTGRFGKFVLVGGLAATVNFLSRIGLSFWLDYPIAIIVAYGIGMATAFTMNRRYVFHDATNRLHHQMLWFVIVNAAALAQTLVISLVLANWLLPHLGIFQHAHLIAHGVGIVIPIFTSYLGHKHYSFAAKARIAEPHAESRE